MKGLKKYMAGILVAGMVLLRDQSGYREGLPDNPYIRRSVFPPL